jgi:hypothetical protein
MPLRLPPSRDGHFILSGMYLAISVVRHEFQIKEKSGCNVF